MIKMPIKYIFHKPGGQNFRNTMVRSAFGDVGVLAMYRDNIMRYDPDLDTIVKYVAEGELRLALMESFKWKDTPEGEDFWTDICDGLETIVDGGISNEIYQDSLLAIEV